MKRSEKRRIAEMSIVTARFLERSTTAKKRLVEIPMPRVREAIVDRLRAGDTVALLAWDYGYTRRGIEFCLREALKAKAEQKRRGRKILRKGGGR